MGEAIFDELGATVDREFVRFGTLALRLSEIKLVDTKTVNEDSHVSPMLWSSAVVSLLLSFGAPILLLFVFGFAGAAVYKNKHRKPPLHMLLISTGGIGNTHIYRNTDGAHIERLRTAIEQAVSGKHVNDDNSAVKTTVGSSSVPKSRQLKAGPWG